MLFPFYFLMIPLILYPFLTSSKIWVQVHQAYTNKMIIKRFLFIETGIKAELAHSIQKGTYNNTNNEPKNWFKYIENIQGCILTRRSIKCFIEFKRTLKWTLCCVEKAERRDSNSSIAEVILPFNVSVSFTIPAIS